MSSLVPKRIAPVGQDFTQAGSRPTVPRSAHNEHLEALLSFFEILGTSNGQPVTHEPQPMQFSEMKSTMPLAYLTIAPGAGHAFRQPGSSQCMQPSLRISHSRRPACTSTSENRITVHEAGVRSRGLSYVPSFSPTASRRSFHCMQATWHAL